MHGPLARYVKLRVAHAPGMFSPLSRVSDPDLHHGTWATHVPCCMPGSLTSDFRWSRCRRKRSRQSRRMRDPQIYLSGKRPIECLWIEQNATTNVAPICQLVHLHVVNNSRGCRCSHIVDQRIDSHWQPAWHRDGWPMWFSCIIKHLA